MQFTDANFDEEVLKSDKPVLVDFWAPWCGPCQMMTPVVEELATEMKETVKIGKCNVDENAESANKYNVMSIPTFLVFKNGSVVDQFSGALGKDDLKERLKQVSA